MKNSFRHFNTDARYKARFLSLSLFLPFFYLSLSVSLASLLYVVLSIVCFAIVLARVSVNEDITMTMSEVVIDIFNARLYTLSAAADSH